MNRSYEVSRFVRHEGANQFSSIRNFDRGGTEKTDVSAAPAVQKMAVWRNGIASDYDSVRSGDCRFDPCLGHTFPFFFT